MNEDNQFLNNWDIERSYVGVDKPLIERVKLSPQEVLEAIQDKQWWRESDRDVRIDMER